MADQLISLVFENTSIRGRWIKLGEAYQLATGNGRYPEVVQTALGEMLCATAMMNHAVQLNGMLATHIQADTDEQGIGLLLSECHGDPDSQRWTVRAVAQHQGNLAADATLDSALHNPKMAIHIHPKDGKSYQGIVPFDASGLSNSIVNYFTQSEQLNTFVKLAANQDQAAGFFIQQLPKSEQETEEQYQEDWNRISLLAQTLTPHELLELSFDNMANRLYHEESVGVYEPYSVNFACSCNREKLQQALCNLNQEARKELYDDQAAIVSSCEFCGTEYSFCEADF